MLPRVPRCIILSYISDGERTGTPGPHQTQRLALERGVLTLSLICGTVALLQTL